jgi:lipopolysaccharide transport system permease protein
MWIVIDQGLHQPVRARSTITAPVTHIDAGRRALAPHLRELLEYRQLLYYFVHRDITVRYRQTVLGAAWALIQPCLTMVIFTVVFGRLAGMPSDNHPYPVFAYTALLLWTYFASALTRASTSLVDQGRLITKVFFPRILVPASAALSGLVDVAIALALLAALLVYYGIGLTAASLTAPLFVLGAAATALGAGLWAAALNVRYRDVRHVMPFALQLWLFLTPVAYPTSIIPDGWRVVYALNPMSGIIDGFRWAVLGGSAPPALPLSISLAAATLLAASGVAYFHRTERTFADVL